MFRVTSKLASAKASLRAIARRWLLLDTEIKQHDGHFETLTTARVPELLNANGMATGTAAEMLLVVGDNPEGNHSEAAFARLCGASPIPASGGKTTLHRLNRGGNRQANAALHRVGLVRLLGHQPALEYVRRRTAEGESKSKFIRCPKRYVAREIFSYPCAERDIADARVFASRRVQEHQGTRRDHQRALQSRNRPSAWTIEEPRRRRLRVPRTGRLILPSAAHGADWKYPAR